MLLWWLAVAHCLLLLQLCMLLFWLGLVWLPRAKKAQLAGNHAMLARCKAAWTQQGANLAVYALEFDRLLAYAIDGRLVVLLSGLLVGCCCCCYC